MKSKNMSMVMTIAIAVIVAALAFFGGMKYQASKTGITPGTGYTKNGQGRFGQSRPNIQGGKRKGLVNGAIGEVTSVDANSLTIKLKDGSSKIVNLSATTTFSKTDTAAKSDVRVGDRIAAFGTTNSDGSVSAQNVQLNPRMGMFRRGLSGTPPQQPQQ